jgi:nucleotide-binding universal stress UspA family protein
MTTPRRILVATDFSEPAGRAFDAALALAARTQAELHLVHALEVALPLFEPYAVVLPADWVGEARRLAQEKLEKAHAAVRARGLSGTTHLGDVPAAHAIADRARTLGADLLVVGTHGHTGLKHVLLGSVAERTVEYAPCAVWTVKGSAADSPRTIVVGTDFSEAEKLIEACERALESFDCPHCKKPVHRLDDGGAKFVQCGCGHLRWCYGKA